MTAKKNAIAKDLRSPKYRPRVVRSKKAYVRRPKHPARAADGLRSPYLCLPASQFFGSAGLEVTDGVVYLVFNDIIRDTEVLGNFAFGPPRFHHAGDRLARREELSSESATDGLPSRAIILHHGKALGIAVAHHVTNRTGNGEQHRRLMASRAYPHRGNRRSLEYRRPDYFVRHGDGTEIPIAKQLAQFPNGRQWFPITEMHVRPKTVSGRIAN